MNFPLHPLRADRRRSQAGIALVMVLICLTLLSILILAFLASASTDLDSSSSFAASADARQRSQTAVSLVIGQIQEATSTPTRGWSSQPGMIRTFSADGSAVEQYKLYSSSAMLEKAFQPQTAAGPTDVPGDWATRAAEYVDLNAPVLVQDNAAGGIVPDSSRPSDKYVAQYPILDPGALGIVKGFGIDVDGDGTSEGAPAATYNPVVSGNPAPMPVQWMYMMQDGSLRTLDPVSKAFSGGAVTADNPPVARIAFWTDDDTCKVNINTAAGDEWDDTTNPGTFMDMPMANSTGESALRNNQPVNHEYQRYPGHPATTYLSAVFPTLTRSQLFDIVPRISWDTKYSAGGTVTTLSYAEDATGANKYAGLPLSDGMPLYASVDELRYARSTTARTTSSAVLTPKQIDYARFFLTTASRAPEVNLFNRPRVTMWPEPADPAARSLFDRSIAFCSTIADIPFYFVRGDNTSPTKDYTDYTRNQEIYAYLQELTALPVPGFGASFLDKYGADRDQILTEIFDYIRCTNLLDTNGTTAFTYNGPVNNLKGWTLRSATAGIGHVVPIQIGDTRGFGRSYTIYQPIIQISGVESTVDDASKLLDTRGMKVSGVYTPPDGVLRGKKTEKADKAKIIVKKVQAIVVFDVFCPAEGVTRMVPNLVFRVKGLNKLSLDGVNLGFPAEGTVDFSSHAPNHEYAWGGMMNYANLFWEKGSTVKKTLGQDPGQYQFVGEPVTVDKEWKSDCSFSGGDGITVEIYSRDKANVMSLEPIQTITLNFPSATVPMPAPSGCYKRTYNSDGAYDWDDDPSVPLTLSKPLSGRSFDSNGMIHPGFNSAAYQGQTIFDVSRSLCPSHGDYRLVMGNKTVPATTYVAGRGYNQPIDKTYSKLYYIVNGEESSGGYVGASPRSGNCGGHIATSGKLVVDPTVTYRGKIGVGTLDADYGPMVPSLIQGAFIQLPGGTTIPGDWDNGMGGVPDGAYINRPDEGERGTGAYGGYGTNYPTVTISTLFSPNRQAPSPVIFGSLSTGVKANKPWQTLLFCANPAGKALHPGHATPPDHLILDLFTMPVVEPYAISEPFSTAGKVNLNYQIVPFTYITRSTALQAVLRSTKVTCIPNTDSGVYKTGAIPSSTVNYRLPIDLEETMKGFQRRFENNEIFKSASQICEMFLIPAGKGATIDNIATWWDSYKITGDNLKERPYANIYSRLTTKSNTYTIYMRVQSLQKAKSPGADYTTWVEGTDKVTSEYRGSCTIERYLNPNLTAAQYNPTQPLTAYKFRTLSTKQFAP